MVYTAPSIQGRLLANMVSGGRNEKCAALTQKCGDDYCLIGAISARNSADLIVAMFLKSKDRNRTMKWLDSKRCRMVMIGLYPKGTDDQMYTSSSKLL